MGILSKVGEVAKDAVLPDFHAWGDIVRGNGSKGDFLSAGLDLASVVPGGMLLKSGGRAAKAAVEVAGDRKLLKQWDSNKAEQLWHGTEKLLGREGVRPRLPRQADELAKEAKLVHKDSYVPGSAFPEGFGAPGAVEKAAHLSKTAPKRGMNHDTYAFASPTEAVAKGYGNGRVLGVMPLSPKKDLRVLSPFDDVLEVADPRGFRAVLTKQDDKITLALNESKKLLRDTLKGGLVPLSFLTGAGLAQDKIG